MKILFLDDMPERREFFYKWARESGHEDITMALDADDAIKWMERAKEPYDIVFLDHDLADAHYQGYMDSKEGTGEDVVKWMIANNKKPNMLCYIHSWNPDGGLRMLNLLMDADWPVAKAEFGPSIRTFLRSLNFIKTTQSEKEVLLAHIDGIAYCECGEAYMYGPYAPVACKCGRPGPWNEKYVDSAKAKVQSAEGGIPVRVVSEPDWELPRSEEAQHLVVPEQKE